MEPRPKAFYYLSAFLVLFIVFLYGPTFTIGILSFQGPGGGLTFPMRGVSLHWFGDLFEQQAVGDIWGSFSRSLVLGLMVMVTTVVVSIMGGLAFRKRFVGSAVLFYFGHHFAGDPFDLDLSGGWSDLVSIRSECPLVQLRIWSTADLDTALWVTDYVCSLQPI